MRRLAATATVFMFAFAFAFVANAAFAGTTSDAVAAMPSAGSTLSKSGGFFQVRAAPGATLSQSVRVTNPTAHGIDVRLAGVDAITQDTTGAGYVAPTTPPHATGTWLTPRDVEFTLNAGESRDVPFSIHVPVDATPGVHLGGITVYSPMKSKSPGGSGSKFRAEVDVQMTRTVAVEIDVPGPAVPNLVVKGAKALVNSKGLVLSVHIANSGTGFAHGTGIFRVPSTGLAQEFKIDTFVPATDINYGVQWMPEAREGTYPVHVHLAWEDGKTVDWDGVVKVTGDTKAALANVKIPKEAAPSPSKDRAGGSSMLMVALVAVGTVLALLVLVGAVALLVRRSRRPRRDDRRARRRPAQRVSDEPLPRSERRQHRGGQLSRGRHRRADERREDYSRASRRR